MSVFCLSKEFKTYVRCVRPYQTLYMFDACPSRVPFDSLDVTSSFEAFFERKILLRKELISRDSFDSEINSLSRNPHSYKFTDRRKEQRIRFPREVSCLREDFLLILLKNLFCFRERRGSKLSSFVENSRPTENYRLLKKLS